MIQKLLLTAWAISICGTTFTINLEDIQRLKEFSSTQEVIIAFQEALAQDPQNARLHHEFGTYIADLDSPIYYQKAWFHLHQAITLAPQDLNWLFEYGIYCCRIGNIEESLKAYQTILSNHPTLISVIYNSGYTFKLAGQNDLAIALYKKVLSLNPNHEQAHLGIAFGLLSKGDYKNGWHEHEWNLKKQNKYAAELRSLIAANAIAGKKILLLPEGGLGDTLNFIRYAQRIHHMGAYTIVAVQRALLPLFTNCPYIDKLIAVDEARPSYDAHATLMSLPAIFADDESTIPQNIPYIFPPQERITYWAKQLASNSRYKIGLCWQPDVYNDSSRLPVARRGIPVALLSTLAQSLPVELYSLQQKEGLDQLATLPKEITIHTFDQTFDVTHGSFIDTAAVIHSLDLIISTDTATAHLAGAMGKKVWLLLPFSTDWRWLVNRNDTPWYPTMRIFKQPHPFDWKSVIDELHTALQIEMGG